MAILKSNFPAVNSFVIKREVLAQLKFNENLSIAEDWDLWLKLSVRYPFHQAKIMTSYVVDHSARTVRKFNLEKFLTQKHNLLNSLENDFEFFSKRKSELPKINSHMSSYIAIHAMVNKHKSAGLKLFIKSVKLDPSTIFTKRTLAIIKHFFIFW
jgi:hypothetical protein